MHRITRLCGTSCLETWRVGVRLDSLSSPKRTDGFRLKKKCPKNQLLDPPKERGFDCVCLKVFGYPNHQWLEIPWFLREVGTWRILLPKLTAHQSKMMLEDQIVLLNCSLFSAVFPTFCRKRNSPTWTVWAFHFSMFFLSPIKTMKAVSHVLSWLKGVLFHTSQV